MLLEAPFLTGTSEGSSEQRLTMSEKGLRIVQLADLHFGEDETKDMHSKALMRSILTRERPDFIVFSGDQVSGYACWWGRRRLWNEALSVAAEMGIPFATIFGNHDDQPYHLDVLLWHRVLNYAVPLCLLGGVGLGAARGLPPIGFSLMLFIITKPTHLVRIALVQHEASMFKGLSHTLQGPLGMHGVSNYELHAVDAQGAPMATLYFRDSGGGRIPEALYSRQRPSAAEMGIAFVHIPPKAFAEAAARNGSCKGGEQPSQCPGSGSFVLDLGVQAVFVGHDHGNAWCCRGATALLCYGMHSGYGGYSPNSSITQKRGARVIELVWNGSVVLLSTRVSIYDYALDNEHQS
jgi:hypothetical protein